MDFHNSNSRALFEGAYEPRTSMLTLWFTSAPHEGYYYPGVPMYIWEGLPVRIAEYVVVHEMTHLHEPYHTPEFWLRVERAMPDYARRKAWLAEHGMDVEGI